MDLIPHEITTLILTWLKQCVTYADVIYPLRTVNKEWDYIICQSTSELPVKFWYWLAIKSQVNPGIFIPLPFVNLTKMKLYEGYQIDILIANIGNFKQLHTVNVKSIQNQSFYKWININYVGLPLVKSQKDIVVFGALY